MVLEEMEAMGACPFYFSSPMEMRGRRKKRRREGAWVAWLAKGADPRGSARKRKTEIEQGRMACI